MLPLFMSEFHLKLTNFLIMSGNQIGLIYKIRHIKYFHCKPYINVLFHTIQDPLFFPTHILIFSNIGPAVRVFANGPGDLGSIPGRVIPKTLKMVLDTTLLNTQHYKVRFKGKVEQSWEWSSALPYTLV